MIIHVVKQLDTLFSIAKLYNTSVERIRIDNALLPEQQLLIGQALLILEPEQVYTVQSGDTLSSISERFGVDTKELLRNNPGISLDQALYPGQTVILTQSTEKRGSILTNGYAYPFIQNADLNRVLPYLSMITPFTYGIRRDGTLIAPSDTEIRSAAQRYGTDTVMLISTLDENDRFNSELPGILFSDPALREKLITSTVNTAKAGGYRYIDVDFEFLPASQAQNYVSFIRDLRIAANQAGISVIVALAPKTSATQPGLLYEGHLYKELGESADLVLIMTYEWGYTYGPPQAVAPLDKVRRVVEYATSEIAPQKILLGVPNYGYDWQLPYVRGSRATSIGNVDAILLAEKYRQQILYDTVSMTPYFYYTDDAGKSHVVWFEDARSVLGKMNLISEFDLAGFSAWTVMRWFPALWLTANALYGIEN